MSETKNFLTKKVIIVVAVLAVGALSIVLVVSPLVQATAQEQQQQRMMMGRFGEGLPQINGSVSIANETSNFVNENVKVSFLAAAQTAQGQVTIGTVLG